MALHSAHRAEQEDFAVYYVLGEELRHGVNPYTTLFVTRAKQEGFTIHDIRRGTDPPTFLTIFVFLSRMPLLSAYAVWLLINLACLAIALFLLLRPTFYIDPISALILAGFAILYPPITFHFWFGQSKLPVVLLMVLMMRCMERGRDAWAGLSLALGALLRLFPLAIIGYLLLQRRWKTFAWTFVGLVTGSLFTVAFTGVDKYLAFFVSLPSLTHDLWRRDISSYCFIAMEMWSLESHLGPVTELVDRGVFYLLDLIILVVTVRATLALPPGEDPDWRLFSLWIAAAVLVLPIAWDYDLSLMLIPFGQLASAAARGRGSRRSIAMAAASYILIVLWDYKIVPQSSSVYSALGAAVGDLGFFSMVAAYVSAYWFAVDRPDAVRVSVTALPAEVWRRLLPSPSSS
jgi:hypothetical protein